MLNYTQRTFETPAARTNCGLDPSETLLFCRVYPYMFVVALVWVICRSFIKTKGESLSNFDLSCHSINVNKRAANVLRETQVTQQI
eukprot:6177824-Pleurochrysis_carterae.AAC.2